MSVILTRVEQLCPALGSLDRRVASDGVLPCGTCRGVADQGEDDAHGIDPVDSLGFSIYPQIAAVVEAGETPARARHCNWL